MKKQVKPTLQVISMPVVNGKVKINGIHKTNGFGKNLRTFESRFIPRYKTMPEMPIGLPTPTFSESSNKILKERYLKE